jgi:hypothetical protein
MDSMKEVYDKLKKEYKDLDVVYDENKDTIDITSGNYSISANDKLVELSKSLSYVNHKVNKDYREVYKTIVKYVKDPSGYFRAKRIQIIVVFIVSLILTFCIGLLIGL